MPRLYVSNKDESVRLFNSDFLDKFTRVHWTVPMILYLPVVGACLYLAVDEGVVTVANGMLLFVTGLVGWTLTEYLMHRFIFHYEPRSEWGKKLHFFAHGVHHDYPNDSKRLVLPPSVSIPLAFFFYYLFRLIFGPFFLMPYYAGFILGYVFYDTIHYATHHLPMKGKIGLFLKQYHILHHYQDFTLGFGVSSPLWDHIFGTVNVRERKAEAKSIQA